MSGVAITASKSVQPPLIRVTTSSPPMISAPASSASRSLSPCAITSTVFDLPMPCGSTSVPRTNWSALRGSTPSQTVNSTVSSNFAKAISLTFATPDSRSYLRPSSTFSSAARYFFPCFFIFCSEVQTGCFAIPPSQCSRLLNREAHLPRSTLDRLYGRLEAGSVQVGKFGFGDLFDLRARDSANLLAIRLARSFRYAGGFFQQVGSRRSLGFKRERPIREDRDHDRHFQIGIHLRGLGVERLAELHNVHAVLTQRRSDRRRRIRFARGNL